MRTKTLLTAAAALAVGLIASQTQAQVYSANIVGYVSQKFSPNGYTLVANPLWATNSGDANAEQILSALQPGDSILLWNGSGYDNYAYAAAGAWLGPNGPTTAPAIKVGQPFFYDNNHDVETNVFVGAVTLTNSAVLSSGYNMIASVAPIAGPLDGTNFALPLQPGDSILLFNGTGYDNYAYAGPGAWLGPNGPTTNAPSIKVGEGFFYDNNHSDEQWNQGVVVQ